MPEVQFQQMEVEPWVDEVKKRTTQKKAREPGANKTKSAPARQRGAMVPDGVNGFVRASDLTCEKKKKASRAGKKKHTSPDEDTDDELPELGELSRDYASDSDQATMAKGIRGIKRKSTSSSGVGKVKKGKKTAIQDSASDSNSDEQEDFVKKILGSPTVLQAPPSKRHAKTVSKPAKKPRASSSSHTAPRSESHPDPPISPPTVDASARWMLDLDDDEFPIPSGQISSKMSSALEMRAVGPPSATTLRGSDGTSSLGTDASPVVVRRRRAGRIIATSSPDHTASALPLAPYSNELDEDSVFSPPPQTRIHKSKPRRFHQYVEDDLEVSGDDDMGTAEDTSGEESESDRRFAGHFQATQAPKGYNQRAAYAAGMASQMPRKNGPVFDTDKRRKHDAFLEKARRPILLSQEKEGPSSDYEGSFVCGDETVEYFSGSEDDLDE